MEEIFKRNRNIGLVPVDTNNLLSWVDKLYRYMFSIGDECESSAKSDLLYNKLKNEFTILLSSVINDVSERTMLVEDFFLNLDQIHQTLHQDLESIYSFDPAAKSISEIVLSYPGFYAISIYRVANYLWEKDVKILPRIISEGVHSKTGIDIHPGAKIGKGFFIDHGTGIVIGETAIIGNNVKIYQGVTLGALHVLKEEAQIKRHPTIEDGVIIYANATILGGGTVIGQNSVIGGNVWISSSIPSNSLVFNKSEIIIKNNKVFPEPLNYEI